MNNKKVLLLDFRKEFVIAAHEKIGECITITPSHTEYNIIALNDKSFTNIKNNLKADIVLCYNLAYNKDKIDCKNIITCGMSEKNIFGLSSVDTNRSMFSVSKPFNYKKELILPFEEPFKPDINLSIYENIVLHGIQRLSQYEKPFQY